MHLCSNLFLTKTTLTYTPYEQEVKHLQRYFLGGRIKNKEAKVAEA